MAAGTVGMFVAVKSNLRTGAAAAHSVEDGLRISMRGGAVSGILVVSLSLIGVFAMFIAYGGFAHPAQAPFTILWFRFCASLLALLPPPRGGLYTQAAAPRAHPGGKVEGRIPAEEPRNASV